MVTKIQKPADSEISESLGFDVPVPEIEFRRSILEHLLNHEHRLIALEGLLKPGASDKKAP